MAKTAFVTRPNKRMLQAPNDGPFERVLRLDFQLQELPALIPTVVTREGETTGVRKELTRVPRQAFVVAPLLSIAASCSTSGPAGPAGSHPHPTPSPSTSQRAFVPPSPPHLDAAGLSLPGYAPGYKDRNQDSALLLDTFLSNRQQLAAVMDGHGPEGHRVAAFIARNLPYTLLNQLIDDREGGGGGAGGGVDAPARPGGGPARPPLSAPPPPSGPDAASGPVQRALWRSVTALDEHLARSGIDDVYSGTTAALCHVHGRRLTAAWVGDSRMVLGLPGRRAPLAQPQANPRSASGPSPAPSAGPPVPTTAPGDAPSPSGRATSATSAVSDQGDAGAAGGGWRVAWRSMDHKPELPEETARIEEAGGRVARSVGPQGPMGPYRVWFKNEQFPGLAMSRALGDRPGRQIGITATPSLATLQLPDNSPAVVVLASDGVWELLGDEQVLQLAAGAGSAAEGASRVVHQSRRAWVREYGGSYIDDITALVLRFNMQRRSSAH